MNKSASVLLFILIMLSGCSRYSIDPPSGFAAMKKNGNTYFFSPDGVRIKISVFPNSPEKDTEFWEDALNNHLEKKGYRHLKTEETEAGYKKEYWIIAYGKEYFIYLTSVYSNKRYIVSAEASGEKALFEKYENIINQSLSTLKIR